MGKTQEVDMFRAARIGIAIAAACAAGVIVYELVRRSAEEELVMPVKDEGGGRLIRFPADRPPYAEEAQSAAQ